MAKTLSFRTPARNRRSRRPTRVDRLAARAHGDEAIEARRARLGFLRALQAIEDRVAVGAVELLEEAARAGVPRQRRGQILGHARGARALIGALPAPVAPGALDLGQPG